MSDLCLVSQSARRVLVLANPKAGRRHRTELLDRLATLLKSETMSVDVLNDIATLQSAIANTDPADLRAVVAAGGDGTIGLVANSTPPGTPLALLPLGTENLLAKYLGATADPAALAASLIRGRLGRFDAGQANDRLFLLMAGCGFDAEVVRRLHDCRRGNISHFTYIQPILASIRSYRYPTLRVYCRPHGSDGPERQIDCKWAFTFNLPKYGMGLRFAPRAVGTDGLLDVCTFARGSLWNGLRYLTRVILCRHERSPECVAVQTPELRIESDEPVPFQLDGDPGGMLPVTIRVLPNRLTFVLP